MKKILFTMLMVVLIPASVRAYERTSIPIRIISLKPNITEILFALGVGDKVVGDTTWCDWPVEAKKLPKVADYININTEKIIALRPDLVIGSTENAIKGQFDVIENAGIKTLLLSFRTIDDLYSSIEKIANAVGKKDEGLKVIHKIKDDLTIARAYDRTSARKVLILVGRRPLIAAGDMTFYGDILRTIGVKNIVESKKTPYPTINTEFIVAKNPDVIIDLAMGSEANNDLPKIIKGKVKQFNMSDFRAGPRLGEAVKRLNETLNL